MVIRNVEGDTVKQFQLIDSKTRLMIDDIRSQIFTNKASHDTELSKVETRLSEKIFDSLKNNDKYVSRRDLNGLAQNAKIIFD